MRHRSRVDGAFGEESLIRWLKMAEEQVHFQGLPARICWLGHGERHLAGLRFNELVASGEVKAPIVIGRDHLDAGSCFPYRETEAMRDGSDAIGDWPILNALTNVASGATWVSVHHGGGVGIGYSLHAGMVVVADGTRMRRNAWSGCCPTILVWAWFATSMPDMSAPSSTRAKRDRKNSHLADGDRRMSEPSVDLVITNIRRIAHLRARCGSIIGRNRALRGSPLPMGDRGDWID